jgi:hypothetical protein
MRAWHHKPDRQEEPPMPRKHDDYEFHADAEASF